LTQEKRSPLEDLGQGFFRSTEPMWIYDRETLAFLEVNQAAQNRYGYSREEFLRMTILDIRPPEDIPEILRRTLRPQENVPVVFGQSRHVSRKGEIFEVRISRREVIFHGRPANLVVVHCPSK
jgi:PAS domain S-box-containing protein